MKFAIIVFPGSNCDRDCHHVVTTVCGQHAEYVWHQAPDLPHVDAVILPGGFSYGDYLRAGAIARQAPIMAAVRTFAAAGGLVLGICNGFQVLTEAGLLPGAFLRNAQLRFACRAVHLRVERTDTPFTCAYDTSTRQEAGPVSAEASAGRRRRQEIRNTEYGGRNTEDGIRSTAVVRMPIAHMDGNYFADAATLRQMEERQQILFRYCDQDGVVRPGANPNGSAANIAGICNAQGNVVGLMPHPERCSEAVLGGIDGKRVFESMIQWASQRIS